MKFTSRLHQVIATSGCAIVVMTLGVSCSDTERTGANFCGALEKQLPGLTGPLVATSDIGDLLSRYRSLAKITPLAIEDDWKTVTELIDQASVVDPEDPLSRQELADAAYKAERPARNIAMWVESTCGLAMPDVIGLEGSIAPETTIFAP
jgi:hypothetical protein